jgi:hypothetical protein
MSSVPHPLTIPRPVAIIAGRNLPPAIRLSRPCEMRHPGQHPNMSPNPAEEMIAMDQFRVLLVGGPTDLTFGDCVREVPTLVEPIKVARGNGYEHFRYSGESRDLHGSQVPVFEWCDRTKLAE